MNTPERVTFKNQPKLYSGEADQKFNERRVALAAQIENFILTDELFIGKEVVIEFAQTGVSSLVCFLQTEDKRFVLKIPLSLKPTEGEGRFLSEWEAVGVSVPHVFKEGKIAEYPFILMSYIDAPMLSAAKKAGLVGPDIEVEMGRTLRLMHTTKAKGYGHIVKGMAQYETFEQWLFGEDVQKRIKEVTELKLLDDEHGKLSEVLRVLIAHCQKDPSTTYCHFDFGTGNLMATNPLTVIDPYPLLSNWVIDIGRTIQLVSAVSETEETIKRLKKGYFGDPAFDSGPLQAAIILSAYMKFPYWNKKHKTEAMENVKAYLMSTRHLLK